MTARLCLHCGEPVAHGARCPCVERARQRPSSTERGYDAEWRRLSQRARRLQPFCSFCFATEDLTTDHLVALARGGSRRPTLAGVLVLCRPCNSRKGTRPATAEQLGLAGLDPGHPPRTEPNQRPASHASGWSLGDGVCGCA